MIVGSHERLWAIAGIGHSSLLERLWRQRPGVVVVFGSEMDAQRVAKHPHTVDRSGPTAIDAWQVCEVPPDLLAVLRADPHVRLHVAGAVSAEGHYAAVLLEE